MAVRDPLGVGPGDALVVVDVQRDFLPGGSLGVPGGDQVVPIMNGYLALFRARGLPIIASRDWHPREHCSFQEHGGVWPAHCVAETDGASFAGGLELPADAIVVSKATAPDKDAYSAFEGTDLAATLNGMGVRRVFVGGLATDYCVLNTALDARRLGFQVVLLEDAMRAVDASPGDGERAVARMRAAGCEVAAPRAARP